MEKNVKSAWRLFRSMEGGAATWRSDLVARLTLGALGQMATASQRTAAIRAGRRNGIDVAMARLGSRRAPVAFNCHLVGGAAIVARPAGLNSAAKKPS